MSMQKAILTTTGEKIDVFVTANAAYCPGEYRDCLFSYPCGAVGIQRVRCSKIKYQKQKKAVTLKQ